MKLGSPHSWRSKAALLKFTRTFFVLFGIFWLLLEPMALWRPADLRWGIRGYFLLTGISFFGALFWAWPRTAIVRKLPVTDTKISIAISDLLQQTGNIVIGCNDVFDTELGDVISVKSIQGQFQTKIFPEKEALDRAIKKDLRDVAFQSDNTKTRGKKDRYEIGTVAMIEARGNRYFLVAYTRMRNNMRVDSDICSLSTALKECWKAIRERGQHEPIHMAIIGSAFARIGLSRALLVQFIVLSFLDAEKKESLTNHLTIHIHESDAEYIDFIDLEAWLSGLTRAA